MGRLQLRDDDAKEGMGGLTAPRSLVIRLEETTKGVQKGDRVLAVFPDTTSFYVGTIHRVSGRAVSWLIDKLPTRFLCTSEMPIQSLGTDGIFGCRYSTGVVGWRV